MQKKKIATHNGLKPFNRGKGEDRTKLFFVLSYSEERGKKHEESCAFFSRELHLYERMSIENARASLILLTKVM